MVSGPRQGHYQLSKVQNIRKTLTGLKIVELTYMYLYTDQVVLVAPSEILPSEEEFV